MTMKFYEFNQNNTGGSFTTNKIVCHRVIIQASDADEANRLARDMGIYFDGCSLGEDCSCCGDRWYPVFGEGVSYPYEYDKKIIFKDEIEHAQFLADNYGWTSPDIRIYYKDKEPVEIFKTKRAA